MTGACLLLGATALQLATPVFTLSWTHSVERVEWHEVWEVGDDRLTLFASAVKGSGAGMEPGPEARLSDGWWISPGGLSVERLTLAASGATGDGWTLCTSRGCYLLGNVDGLSVTLSACGTGAGQAYDGTGRRP